MKTYMKPSLEIVELRPEERLASCGTSYKNSNLMSMLLAMFFGWCTKCTITWSGSCGGS